MSAQSPVAADHPLMIAWERYKASAEYENTKRWAPHTEHTEGSLWASFAAGFYAAASAPGEPTQREGLMAKVSPHWSIADEALTPLLSIRTVNSLMNAFARNRRPGLHTCGTRWSRCGQDAPTIGFVCAMSDKELLTIRNFGKRSLTEIQRLREMLNAPTV